MKRAHHHRSPWLVVSGDRLSDNELANCLSYISPTPLHVILALSNHLTVPCQPAPALRSGCYGRQSLQNCPPSVP
jgi:hypothetical protein